MNVAIDTEYTTSKSGKKESTSTQATAKYDAFVHAADQKITISMAGYAPDSIDKTMNTEAYKSHGLTTDDIMQQAAATDVETQKDYMVVMSHTVSEEDFQKMCEDGFDPGSTDPETYVTILDRIKATLAQSGVDIKGYTDTLDEATLEEITGAVTQALEIKNMSDDMVKYLVENQKAPTIDNIYKADYSTTDNMVQTKGYYSDGGYYARKADDINIDNLLSSIEQVVTKAGFTDEERETALETAKWIVESGIELNPDNLTNAYNLRSLEFPLDKDTVTQMCINAVINGKSPYEANITGEKTIDEQSAEIIEKVNNITDEQIHEAVEKDVELNIKNISKIQPEEETVASPTFDLSSMSIKEIRARRQMEEIRLMMTEEANRHLMRQGISVDTTRLSDLVELLKKAEYQIKENLYRGGSPEVNEELEALYNETLSKTDTIANMPAAIIGPISSQIGDYDIDNIYESGNELLKSKTYDKLDLYERIMTAPNSGLGDTIAKAFRNVDDILAEMGMEDSDTNKRAVRILGYNSMDITRENIDTVKQADRQVTDVLQKMTPSNVLKMIRERKNPLSMSMDELDEYLNNIDDGTESSEKYSKFLQKVDQAGDITSEEREAYIGIYRLFNQIEKSDGAVIGSIVASGAEMNFKNMLTAVRTSHKIIDVTVDDGFNSLSQLVTGSKAIDIQINDGFAGTLHGGNAKHQQKYYASLSGEINEELADRTDVSKLKDTNITSETTIEHFNDMLKEIRLEQEQEEKDNQYKVYKETVNNAIQADDEVVQELLDYSQPVTANNIEAAMLSTFEKNDLYRRLNIISRSAHLNDDESEDKEDIEYEEVMGDAEEFIEGLHDKDTSVELYDRLINYSRVVLDNYMYDPSNTYIDVKAAQGMYKALSLMSGLSHEENYNVPIDINGEVTCVNLKIYHTKSKAGKVAITLENRNLGKVAAELQVDNKRITGMVVCESDKAKSQLQGISDDLQEAFEDKRVNLSVVKTRPVELNKFGEDRDRESRAVTTVELYNTAKTVLKSINNIGGK